MILSPAALGCMEKRLSYFARPASKGLRCFNFVSDCVSNCDGNTVCGHIQNFILENFNESRSRTVVLPVHHLGGSTARRPCVCLHGHPCDLDDVGTSLAP
eukprot:gb/GFBE01055329.1/.p1 GENE.gb/GFBE01055329.1/~~gb/GFBE01055329.1/.p1  ORF type:complete len:100 (+),score=17.08 gb/GFBE01055329.1/:1-300(+)